MPLSLTLRIRTVPMIGFAVVLAALSPGARCLAQCDLLLRETFRFGERPHGGNGRTRVVELEDRLHDFWPQASSIGARWISADQAPLPLWQFAWSSVDPAEVDPLEGPDGNGTAFGEPGAAVMIPFAPSPGAFTLGADLALATGEAFIGYTTTTAFVNNFQADGALWISVNQNVDWTLYANGNQVVASGHSLGGGVLDGGFYRVELTFDPVTSQVSGAAAGEPFGPFTVALARPLSYFAMEAHDGWCVWNNISITTGASLAVSVSTPGPVCIGGSATLSATSNAQSPAGYFWMRSGSRLSDGPLSSGAIVSGANTSTLSLSNITSAELAAYTCIVSNDCGLHESASLTLRTCLADFTCDGVLNSQDFFEFLALFFASSPTADVNHDGGVTSQDFFEFIAVFFNGC